MAKDLVLGDFLRIFNILDLKKLLVNYRKIKDFDRNYTERHVQEHNWDQHKKENLFSRYQSFPKSSHVKVLDVVRKIKKGSFFHDTNVKELLSQMERCYQDTNDFFKICISQQFSYRNEK